MLLKMISWINKFQLFENVKSICLVLQLTNDLVIFLHKKKIGKGNRTLRPIKTMFSQSKKWVAGVFREETDCCSLFWNGILKGDLVNKTFWETRDMESCQHGGQAKDFLPDWEFLGFTNGQNLERRLQCVPSLSWWRGSVPHQPENSCPETLRSILMVVLLICVLNHHHLQQQQKQ